MPGSLQLTSQSLRGRTVVRAVGEVDMVTCDDLVAAVAQGMEETGRVELDLSGITFMDASGVHALLACSESAAAQHWDFWLGSTSEAVLRVLSATETRQLFRVLPRAV
ncbi:MAG: STAS domain-containing protein [Solirubrobacteraceae bacterium]